MLSTCDRAYSDLLTHHQQEHKEQERKTRGLAVDIARVNGSQNPRNATSKADIYSVPLARIPIKS